mmetsp:Transcript_46914/g.101946  ORF Transcript_46914/g.101946 Transcript_46914/m.101946 type:complete len:245 (+) Transcript_46914:110-844(+)
MNLFTPHLPAGGIKGDQLGLPPEACQTGMAPWSNGEACALRWPMPRCGTGMCWKAGHVSLNADTGSGSAMRSSAASACSASTGEMFAGEAFASLRVLAMNRYSSAIRTPTLPRNTTVQVQGILGTTAPLVEASDAATSGCRQGNVQFCSPDLWRSSWKSAKGECGERLCSWYHSRVISALLIHRRVTQQFASSGVSTASGESGGPMMSLQVVSSLECPGTWSLAEDVCPADTFVASARGTFHSW